MHPTVKNYLTRNIFEELGLGNLKPIELERLLDAVGSVIQGRIQLRILDALAPDDKELFFDLLEQKKNDEEIDNFLKQKLPNLDDLMATVISECKEEIVEKVKMLGAL